MGHTILEDIRTVRRNDPAAHGWIEVVLCHTPLHAILVHRLAHWLHARLNLTLLARMVAMVARFWTGVEIHPGARIGRGFFVDHGAGVVIGETAVVGDHCVMFHNVTPGGTGKYHGQRHPQLGDHVFIGTNASLIDLVRVGDHAKVGANAFVINRDVPAHSTVVDTPARIVRLHGRRVDEELPRSIAPLDAVPVDIDA